MQLASIAGVAAATEAAAEVITRPANTAVWLAGALLLTIVGQIINVIIAVNASRRATDALKVSREDAAQTTSIAEIGTDVRSIKDTVDTLASNIENLSGRMSEAEGDIRFLQGKAESKGGTG